MARLNLNGGSLTMLQEVRDIDVAGDRIGVAMGPMSLKWEQGGLEITATLVTGGLKVTSVRIDPDRVDDSGVLLPGLDAQEVIDAVGRVFSAASITAQEAADGFGGLMQAIKDERDYEAAPHFVKVAWKLLGKRPRAMPGWEG